MSAMESAPTFGKSVPPPMPSIPLSPIPAVVSPPPAAPASPDPGVKAALEAMKGDFPAITKAVKKDRKIIRRDILILFDLISLSSRPIFISGALKETWKDSRPRL